MVVGYEKWLILENLHNNFLRQIIGLRKKYPHIYATCRIGTIPNDNKNQESIQSSTTPDPGYQMGK